MIYSLASLAARQSSSAEALSRSHVAATARASSTGGGPQAPAETCRRHPDRLAHFPCTSVNPALLSSTINKMLQLLPPLRAQKLSRKNPRGVANSFLGLLLCFVAGCAQQPLHLNTRQQGVRNALAQVDPYHDERPRLARIIDIH